MTNEAPKFPDDESRRIQAEIDRIRSGLKWLRAGQVERSRGLRSDGEDASEGKEVIDDKDITDGGSSEAEDLRSLTERMQSIVDRARMHAERFERLMGRAPEARIITFVEVQEMLAETLAKRRPAPGTKPSAPKRAKGKRKSSE
jgi:phytoene/squalene synthetase